MLKRREFLRQTATGMAAVLAAQRAASATAASARKTASTAEKASRPNLLFVLSDDHSAPFVGCYGDKVIRTPNLDRFAAEGIRFDRAYTSTPQCVPSRASLMTGRSPIAIQMTRFSAPLAGEVPTWPGLLKADGYFTGACRRYFHLDGPGRLDPVTADVFKRHNLQTFAKRLDFFRPDGGRERTAAVMNEFFDKKPNGQPFFFWVGFNDPHRPLDANAIPQPHDPKGLILPKHFPDTAGVREDFARYYDEIGRLDGELAVVLGVLEKRGFAENTVVIFMGDNGGALLRGKGTLYELGCHVPLIVRWPGVVKPGASSAELISGEDITPTFLEAAGVAAPQEMTGRSFLKRLRGEPFEGRKYLFTQRSAHGQGLPRNSAAFDLGRAVTTKTHRFIYNAIWQIPYSPVDFGGQAFWMELGDMHAAGKLAPEFDRIYFSPTRPMFELYDLENDPFEMNNLIGKPEARAVEQELKAALQEWMILERDYVPLPMNEGQAKAAGKGKAKGKKAKAQKSAARTE